MRDSNGETVKAYRPVRIINPRAELHTVRLMPCQGMRLILSDIDTFCGEKHPGAYYDVQVVSPYLSVLKKESQTTPYSALVYEIAQKFNLSPWTKDGHVHLGHIQIRVCQDDDHTQYEIHNSKLCIRLSAASNGSQQVTVINPVEGHVRLGANELLEVVTFESKWNDWNPDSKASGPTGEKDEWEGSDKLEFKDQSLRLVRVAKQVIPFDAVRPVVDGTTMWKPIKRLPTAVNPRLGEEVRARFQKELEAMGTPVRQHHMWYLLDNDSLKAAYGLKNNDYPLGRLRVTGKAWPDQSVVGFTATRTLDVDVQVEARKRPASIKVAKTVKEKETEGGDSILKKPMFNPLTNMMFNPGIGQQCDFKGDFNWIKVEITQPSVLVSGLPADTRWKFHLEDKNMPEKYLTIEELPDNTLMGKNVQIAKVKYLGGAVPEDGKEMKFIGALQMTVDGCDHKDANRRVSFWAVPKNYKSPSTETYTCTGGKKGYTGELERSNVEFEELDSDQDDLGTFAQVKKFSEIVSYTPTIYSPGKKKESGTACSQAGPVYPPYQHVMGNQGNPYIARAKRNGVGVGKAAVANGGTVRHDDTASVTLYDPTHLGCHSLSVGDRLTIRLSSPYCLLGPRSQGDSWEAKVVLADGPVQLKVENSVTVSDKHYQEFVFDIDYSKLPKTVGNHFLGTVNFQCKVQNRMVRVFCEVAQHQSMAEAAYFRQWANTIGTAQMEQREKLFNIKPVEINSSESCRRYRYIGKFNHMDGVVVDTTDAVYIKPPKATGWADGGWTLRIVQKPLSPDVFCKLDPAVKSSIDAMRPWYSDGNVPMWGNCFMLKAPVAEQPRTGAIVQALRAANKTDRWLIGELVFENTQGDRDMLSKMGIRTLYPGDTIKQSFGLFINLESVKRTEKAIEVRDFSDGEVLSVGPGDEIKVTIAATIVPESWKRNWYVSGLPDWIEQEDIRHNGMETYLKLKVGANPKLGITPIRFISDKGQRYLKLQINDGVEQEEVTDPVFVSHLTGHHSRTG